MSSALACLIIIIACLSLGVLSNNQGYVRVCNRGAYVATCGLNTRTADGRTRSYETDNFPAAQCRVLELPYESVWGQVWCDNFVFIGVRKRVFTEEYAAPFARCYDIGGTTFHPSKSNVNC